MAWRQCQALKSGAGRRRGSDLRLFETGRFAVVLVVDPLVVHPVALRVGARIEGSAGSSESSAVCRLCDFQTSLRLLQFGTPITLCCRLGSCRSH